MQPHQSLLAPAYEATPANHPTDAPRQYVGTSDRMKSDQSDTVRQAHHRMELAFVTWHMTGCINAADAYHKARQAWELALMNQPTGAKE